MLLLNIMKTNNAHVFWVGSHLEKQNLSKLDKCASKAFSFPALSTHWTVQQFTVGGTSGGLYSNILLQAGSPAIRSDQAAQDLIHPDLETLHGQRLQNPSELPVPMLHCKKVPPLHIPTKICLFNHRNSSSDNFLP